VKSRQYAALIGRLKSTGDAVEDTRLHLPTWVGSRHLLVEGEAIWIYIEPNASASGTEPGQLVLELPAARYMVEILDIASGTWISRESAAGGPLVAGLPFSKNPQLIRIAKTSENRGRYPVSG
jgi:hypothetical protein